MFSDDLQFHLLELPKFTPAVDNVRDLPPLERWLYFLRHAEDLEADELSRLLVEAEYTEALEVLEMISRSPEDRQFYEARLKFLHDEEARLIAARAEGKAKESEGKAEGLETGTLVGKVQVLQQLLGDQERTTAELVELGEDALSSMLVALQQRLRLRNS